VRRLALAAVVAAAALTAGCGDDEAAPAVERSTPPELRTTRAERPAPRLRQVRCRASESGCRRASGRIIYVERVDPDGDGDAHFVLASRHSITAPGISVIDVRKGLRPSPLPGRGDLLSAAGPVFEGSYGQRQIHAVRLSVAVRD
jgi:hypothetical protein